MTGRQILPFIISLLLTDTLPGQQPLVDSTPRRSCALPRPLAGIEDSRPPRVRDKAPHCLTHLEVFADGNIKNVLGTASANAVASGALGMKVTGSLFEVSGLVNVAGVTDTVSSSFGNTLLAPATGRGLNAASLSIRRRWRDWGDPECLRYIYRQSCHASLRLEVNATSRMWGTEFRNVPPAVAGSDSVSVVTATSEVPMYGIDFGWSNEFFRGTIVTGDSLKRPASMLLDVGYSRRAIRGDLGSTRTEVASIRERLLGSSQRTFDGYHAALALSYGQIESRFTYLWLNGDVRGVSGGQVIGSVSLRAALISGLLRRE